MELELFSSIGDTFFKFNIFKQYMKSFAECRDIYSEPIIKITKDDSFHRHPVRGGRSKRNSHGTLYIKSMTGVPQKVIEICGRELIVFRPEQTNAL